MVKPLNPRTSRDRLVIDSCGGMTLIELLAVMVIMMVIIAGMSSVSNSSALNLSTAAGQVQGTIRGAHQLALTFNKYIQVRFYRAVGSEDYEAVGMFLADSPYYSALATSSSEYDAWSQAKVFKQMGKVEFLPQGCIIPAGSGSPGISPLLDDLNADTAFPRKGRSRLRGTDYDWVAFYFRPNGVTDFDVLYSAAHPGSNAFFSIVLRNDYGRTKPILPPNFMALTLSPANGAQTLTRP